MPRPTVRGLGFSGRAEEQFTATVDSGAEFAGDVGSVHLSFAVDWNCCGILVGAGPAHDVHQRGEYRFHQLRLWRWRRKQELLRNDHWLVRKCERILRRIPFPVVVSRRTDPAAASTPPEATATSGAA
jgi:hypothetical protein